MKLSKSIITEIQKQPTHNQFSFEMFYKVTYMDDTTKTYLLPTDDFSVAREWYKEWSKNFNESIHKVVHLALLRNTREGTIVEQYNVKKCVTDYGDNYKPQVF